MKKILTSIAMALLLVGCAKQYDDSAIQTKIADLERRVTALESSVDALRSAIGEGVFVAKVQEYADPETGKIIGVTVTYTDGDVKYFEITPKADYAGPVISIIKNGAGDLVWAVDGIAIKDADGKDVTVYQTPVFTIDGDGNLLVSIDGGDPIILGQVQNEGATLVDGIFTNIEIGDNAFILTLSDNSTVSVPFAAAFKLVLAEGIYTFDATKKPIEIPYTVSAKTAATVVDVIGYSVTDFNVVVEEEKIVITPLKYNASAVMMAYADTKMGITSIAKIAVEPEGVTIVDTPWNDEYDYVATGEDGSVVAHVVSNVEFDVVPDDEWIHLVDVKSTLHTITLALDDNETGKERLGGVFIYKKDTKEPLQIFTIAQGPIVGPRNLSKKGTANCYIVTKAGEYKFSTVKGNSTESVGAVNKAEILWETWNNDQEVTPNSVIASVAAGNGIISFATPSTLKPGNALIAAKDENGVILWSWHIWIPETTIATVVDEVIFGSQAIMDRNLGALVAAPADAAAPAESYGFLYEWGRKDPFPGHGSVSADGAAKLAGTQMTSFNGTITVAESIQNPTKYVYSSGDWCVTEEQSMKFWTTEKTIYDPCPVGYIVPTRNGNVHFWSSTELNALAATDNFVNNGATFYSFSLGTSTPVVFPYAGYIDNDSGAHYKSAKRAAIWSSYSSTAGKAYSRDIRHDSNTFKRSELKNSRAASVRCVTEVAAN